MAHHPQAEKLPTTTGLKADKGIELLTWATANGIRASIFLEELKEAYDAEYTAQVIHLFRGVQKQPWFLELNPNGRIPVIVDHDIKNSQGKPATVGESTAILQHLARHHDPEGKFKFNTAAEEAQCEQWLAFASGELGATGSSLIKFYRFLPTYQSFPLAMYSREMTRLHDVLEAHLSKGGRDYLVGPGAGKYSIADIANFTWVNSSMFAGTGTLEKWPALEKWCARIWARQSVKRGVDVLYPSISVNERMLERIEGEDGFREKEDELRERLRKALEENPPLGPPGTAGKK